MNVPFDPDTFALLLKSQLIFIDHLLYARHFAISLVAFKGIGSGLHRLFMRLFYLLMSTPNVLGCLPTPFAGLDHGICSWKTLA